MIAEPQTNVNLGPRRPAVRAASGAATIIASRRGHPQTGLQHRLPQAEARSGRQLEHLRTDQRQREHREAHQDRGDVGGQHRPPQCGAQIHDRRRGPELPAGEDREHRDGEHEQRQRRRTGPAPGRTLEIGRSRVTSPTASSRVPSGSNRSAELAGTLGTRKANSSIARMPRTPAPQNNVCQSAFWAITADSGRPIAPPTPSDELISPIAGPTRSAGSASAAH